jgi:hypothetical protein
MINAEFTQLIKLLSAIKDLDTEAEQLAAIELRLVEAELNPNCLDFEHLTRALEVLAKVNPRAYEWTENTKDLEQFFSKSL